MMKYTTDVVKTVSRRVRVPQRLVSEVLNSSYRVITEYLAEGQRVQLTKFGSFYTRNRPASQVRNFRTNKVMEIGPMRLASFKAGATLKARVRKPLPAKKKGKG